jgi:hypothetical protein
MERLHRLSPLFRNKHKFIKNTGLPICIKCNNYNKIMKTCEKFGVVDIVSGEISYLSANECRTSNALCDMSGIFFTPVLTPNNSVMRIKNIQSASPSSVITDSKEGFSNNKICSTAYLPAAWCEDEHPVQLTINK